MTNRRTQDPDYLYDSEDDPIGLTSAFPPAKGPQSVEYDKGDSAIGLTGAFAPIPDQNEQHAWDEAGKWSDFDWASYDGEDAAPAPSGDGEGDAPEGGSSGAGQAGSASGASAAVPPVTSDSATAVRQSGSQGASSTAPDPASRKSGRGRHAAPSAEMSPRMQQARKMRRALIAVLVVVVIVIGVVAFFTVRTFSSSQEEAAHQAQEQVEAPKDDIGADLSDDAAEIPVRATDVPYLVPAMGMTADEAIDLIGHGAVITANRPVDEEGNPVKANLNVALTDEPVDSKTGSPTVYLGLDQDGKVVEVGYSASAGALGFGSLSFADAVNGERVIEKTLAKVGVNVPEGSAVLPDDKGEYSTYAADGSTVTRERCSFEGDVDVSGTPCTWSAVLSYDYTTQIVTGDLSDTVRVIYVYVTQI